MKSPNSVKAGSHLIRNLLLPITLALALLLAASPPQLRHVGLRIPALFGSVESMLELGRIYAEGDSAHADASESYKWYFMAAASESPVGMFHAGVALLSGTGVSADSTAAARWFERAANSGLSEAQYNLGLMHEYGIGVVEDHQRAVSLYMSSAKYGLPKAQWALGTSYKLGKGLSADKALAAYWFRCAAENGEPLGMVQIGNAHYVKGGGVEQSYPEAFSWYQQAVGAGNAGANYSVAMMYYEGRGVPRDDLSAAAHATRVAHGDDYHARYLLGRLYGGTSSAVGQDNLKAHQYYLEAAMNGCEESPYQLALMYEQGDGAARDAVEAYAWQNVASFLPNSRNSEAAQARERLLGVLTPDARFRAEQRSTELRRVIKSNTDAARIRRFHASIQRSLYLPPATTVTLSVDRRKADGNPAAQHALADSLIAGKVHPRDSVAAYELYEAAHRRGHAPATLALARCYLQGRGVPQSYFEAASLLEALATEKSDVEAQAMLGWLYSDEGPYVDTRNSKNWHRDPSVHEQLRKSMHWFQKASEQGHAEALYQLGRLYQTGVIVDQDNALAVQLWTKAASKGHLRASWDLGTWYTFGIFVTMDKVKGAELLNAPKDAGIQEFLSAQASQLAYEARGIDEKIEAYAWANVAAMSGDDNMRDLRDTLAKRIGPAYLAIAQNRSKKLVSEIEGRRRQSSAK